MPLFVEYRRLAQLFLEEKQSVAIEKQHTMANNLQAAMSIKLKAPVAKVWDPLTNPAVVNEDRTENYNNVVYALSGDDQHTILTLSQDNLDDEKDLKHSEENWCKVLDNMKCVIEE
ncbi:MAG: hypothetical protein V4649_10895 [Bacteroidota bacterium]